MRTVVGWLVVVGAVGKLGTVEAAAAVVVVVVEIEEAGIGRRKM